MKRMLINATQAEERRLAIVDGQKLLDYEIEIEGREQRKEIGNIEKRLQTKEEALDKRAEALDKTADKHIEKPQSLRSRYENSTKEEVSGQARELAAKSLEKGYLPDALRYLNVLVEGDPTDFDSMVKLIALL